MTIAHETEEQLSNKPTSTDSNETQTAFTTVTAHNMATGSTMQHTLK